MYFTYILLSQKDKSNYTGYTNDLHKRLTEHSLGKVQSTKFRLPMKLIYYEVCGNKEDAKAREKYLKSGMGKRYIKNRLKNYFKNF